MNVLVLSMLVLQASGPFARTRVEPEPDPVNAVTVGQPVSVVVEVLVPSYFMGAPGFPDVDVSDALVVFEPRGTNFTERIGGETFAGQSRRYTIYPQRPGGYEIPAIPVTVRYFAGSGPVDATVSPAPVRFAARVPPEAAGLGYFIATTDLSIREEVVPDTRELEVGESVTRTLTLTVEGALSMVIPPVAFEPIPGLGVYPEPAMVSDTGGERGRAIVGTRVETVSYVAEREGSYRLPEVELAWWDVNAERLRQASVPRIELIVAANPDLVSEFALPEQEPSEKSAEPATPRVSLLDRLKRFGIPLVALALFVVGLNHLVKRFPLRAGSVDDEASYFRRFRRAACSDDPAAAARALMFWLDRRRDQSGTVLFRDFADEAEDPSLEREAETIDRILYTDSDDRAHWSGKELYRRVERVRRKKPSPKKQSSDELPPLNP